jgi:hypothetical protein
MNMRARCCRLPDLYEYIVSFGVVFCQFEKQVLRPKWYCFLSVDKDFSA